MLQRYRLLHLLADGRFHSGEELGAALGVGRGAVWKVVHTLEDLELDVFAVPGRGYRLARPIGLLDRGAILEAMDPEARALVGGLDIHPTVDSTNRLLMERRAAGLASGFVCLAEHQSAGRGRRGRAWVSPFGANLYLSVLWRFELGPEALAALSLVVGVCIAETLRREGVTGVGLKWPNDVYWEGRKLAGILLEMSGESSGYCDVVVGVGINVNMPRAAGGAIDQPWVDLGTIGGRPLDRNRLAAGVLDRLLPGLTTFAMEGFEPFRVLWNELDIVSGRPVAVLTPHGTVCGTATGVDAGGALLLESDGRVQRYISGEVSLRPEP